MLLRSMKGVGPTLWGAAPAPQRPWGHVLGQGAQPSTRSSLGGHSQMGTLWAARPAPASSTGALSQGSWACGPSGERGNQPRPRGSYPTEVLRAGQVEQDSREQGLWRAGSPSPPRSTRRRLKGSEHQAADTQVIHNVLFKSSPSPRLAGAAASSCAGPRALDAAPAGPGAGSAPSLTRNHRAASRRAPGRAHITASMCRILRASEIWTLVSI